jgi:hypothetical protein
LTFSFDDDQGRTRESGQGILIFYNAKDLLDATMVWFAESKYVSMLKGISMTGLT